MPFDDHAVYVRSSCGYFEMSIDVKNKLEEIKNNLKKVQMKNDSILLTDIENIIS
jgi:hypothetical protein